MTAEQDRAPDTRERLSGPALIADTVKRLPNGPGVYRMLDAAGEVLYVGKARDLKKRVANYAKGIGHTSRIARMISETAEMVIVTTRSETEALLLEANLIKRMRPRYNVSYRDDKSFPHILLRTDHAFPQVLKHRGAKSQKGHYFGPFASAYSVSRTLNTLQRAFLLRSCSDSVFEGRTRPCLLFQIKRCSAPCVGRIDEAGYAALVGDAEKFLRGDSDPIREHLLAEMNAAAEALDFEKAAAYRDRIRAIARIEANQVVNPETFDEADVFAIHLEAGRSCVQVFFFRAGQNWGNRAYFPTHDKGAEAPEILESLIAQFYDDKTPPKQIIVSEKLDNAALLAEALSV